MSGSYDKQRDFELLGQEMASHEKGPSNRLFYLALPPSVFKPVTTMLKVRKDDADKTRKVLKRRTEGGMKLVNIYLGTVHIVCSQPWPDALCPLSFGQSN